VTLYNDSSERLIRNIEREAQIKMTRLEARDFLASGNSDSRDRRDRERRDSRERDNRESTRGKDYSDREQR
jgi:hypothetical protein